MISDTTRLMYDAEDAVYFKNPVQSAFYMENGAILLDVFVSGEHKIVFVFSKADHERLRRKWNVRDA